ncbi:PD-(D/E)XK nuclease domain-containing protein [Sporofaciens sp. JLR.KK001]|uniref:PD-(D/E)XK nuclease domain-containing protein n=1 Tax=Sporofaciens sp. JLR.KK001 TaxID=3112621 RepID=UPI002FF2F1B0
MGYTDIMIKVPSEKIGCIMEVKYAAGGSFDTACKKAMTQIEDSGYVSALHQEGMQVIHKFGIACHKKSCKGLYDK